MKRNLFSKLQNGLIEIRDHPEKLNRMEKGMIEISEKYVDGVHKVLVDSNHVGDIVKTDRKWWLAIPSHYRSLPMTSHKLRRDAVSALN